MIRGFLGRQRVARLHRAAKKIQSSWYRWSATRKSNHRLATICCIQAFFKRCLAQHWFSAAIVKICRIQLFYRARLDFLEHRRKMGAALTLGRWWRATSSRKMYVHEMELFRHSVKTIEGAKKRQQYLRTQQIILRIQSHCKSYLNGKRTEKKVEA